MRAAVYIRVSTEEQAETGYSLAGQEEVCAARAKELGADSVVIYADAGVSGAVLDRPRLAALRADVRAGQVDLIVCRDPDRLSRKLAHQLILTEEFEKAGVRLEFINFDWQDTPEGRLFYSVRGAISEYEREKIRERMSAGRLQKARQGGVPMNFDIYGYSYDPESGKVTLKDGESEVVAEIFERFLSGWGYNTIARWLNERAVPTRRGRGAWHKQVVTQIIANPAYAGTWYYRRHDYTGDRHGDPLPPDKWIPIPVPPVVSEAQWLAAQEKAKEARRLWANRGKHDYLLSGIITCGDCGLPMGGAWTKFWGQYDRRYTCQRNIEGAKSKGCRPRKMILARLLEDAVWRQVRSWLADPDALAREALADWPETEKLHNDLIRVDKLLLEAERGRENVLTTLASGLFELDAKTKGVLAELKRKAEKLSARKKEIETALARTAGAEQDLAVLRTAGAKLLARMEAWPFDEKRDMTRALVQQVIVTGRPKPGDAYGDIVVTVLPKTPDSALITSLTRQA